jgi:hypothetical protein
MYIFMFERSLRSFKLLLEMTGKRKHSRKDFLALSCACLVTNLLNGNCETLTRLPKMKHLFLLFLALFGTSIAQVLQDSVQIFEVILPEIPAPDACEAVMTEVVQAIENIVNEAGTDYITKSGYAGQMYSAEIDLDSLDSNRDLVEETEVILKDMDEQGRRLFTFLYGRVPCRMCPPDNSDGRRNLKNVGNAAKEYTMVALEANVNRWIKIRLPQQIRKFSSKECGNELVQWTPSITFKGRE